MEIDVTEKGQIRLKKVFEPIILETEDGLKISICQRDGGFEVSDDDGADLYTGSNSKYHEVWDKIKGNLSKNG